MNTLGKISVGIVGVVFFGLGVGQSAQAATFNFTSTGNNNTFAQADKLPSFGPGDTVVIVGNADPPSPTTQYFSFSAKPAEIISASVSTPSLGANPTISLYNSKHQLLTSSNLPGPAAAFPYDVKSPGTYFAAYNTGSNASPGNYGFLVEKINVTPSVAPVPEPSNILGVLAIGILGGRALLQELKERVR